MDILKKVFLKLEITFWNILQLWNGIFLSLLSLQRHFDVTKYEEFNL